MTRQRIKKELQTLSYVNRSFLAVEVAGGIVWAQMETAPHEEAILLTILLKHGQSKNLGEIRAQLEKNCFYQNFPPAGVEVVSWYVIIGIGQVVTLGVPPAKLREVNLAVERGAWGAFRTEFYAKYDYKLIWQEQHQKYRANKDE